jgi:hypothetical protein
MSVQFVDSKPTNAELASFASRAKEIDVGGGDIQELGDDFGVNLLANPSKVGASPKSTLRSPGQEVPRIEIKQIDDVEVVNLDANPGGDDIRIKREEPFVINTGFGSPAPAPVPMNDSGMSPEQEAAEKQRYLTKVRRVEGGNRMTMTNSLADIKTEYDRLTDSRNLEASIRFQRNALMTFVTGVEMVNDRFGDRLPMKPKLKGWSESVHTNVEDFDEIFEELYDMYKDQAKMHPMLRLAGTLGVSATMYHLTNSMAERSGIPGMSDLLNENPELQRQFAAAAAAKMGGGFGNFMAASMPQVRPEAQNTRVPFNMAAAAFDEPVEAPTARREMRGPSGVDDILRAFEAERSKEVSATIQSQHASVFTNDGPPPSPPVVTREGVGTRVDPLAEFMASDAMSMGSENTTNTEKRRGRRRAAPVGATLNLNV